MNGIATSSTSPDRFEHLLDALVDGVITDAEHVELTQHLRSDAASRTVYANYVALHSLLSLEHARPIVPLTESSRPAPSAVAPNRQPSALSPEPPAPSPVLAFLGRATHAFNRPVTWSIGVAALLFTCYAGFLLWGLRDKSMPIGTAGNDTIVATITGSDSAEWSSSSVSPRPAPGRGAGGEGQDIAIGRPLAIKSGLVELQLKQGATLVIEGPAEWTIDGANTATLTRGKLVAKVPQQAIGFTLETQSTRLVDLGTEFAVETDQDGKTEVQVLKGEVEVQSKASESATSGSVRLSAGQSAQIDRLGNQRFFEQAADGSVHSLTNVLRNPSKQQSATPFQGPFIAYEVPATTKGNQDYRESLGMDFDLAGPAEILSLGAFDDQGNGFAPTTTITVELWRRNNADTPLAPADDRGECVLAKREFTAANPGKLIGGSRFLPLQKPLLLEAGSYTIVARGFNELDQNSNALTAPPPWIPNDGGGRVWFVGLSRCGGDAFPMQLDYRTPYQYAAGTFEYRRVPKPN